MNAILPVGNMSQRQFAFINEGRLLAAPTVRQLLRYLDPANAEDCCNDILNRFLADSSLYAIPVIDSAARPVALVDRKSFVEFFTKNYSREIFGRRSILSLLESGKYDCSKPIVVEETCTVEDAANIIIGRGMEHMVTGFLITHESCYIGAANGHDLLNVITQRKQSELYYLAHYDSLTGLPNRMLLGDRLEQACRDAERKKTRFALLFIDVDRFKQINDSMGHRVGDEVLRRVVDRLKNSARKMDTVARLGGDEFVILMEDLSDRSDADVAAKRLLNSMLAPIELHGHLLNVTVSVGCSVYPDDDDGDGVSALLAKADAAMYEAKVHGRNGYQCYEPGSSMYNPANMVMENELRQAIERDELILYFQPQVQLSNQQLQGAEALVRWRHPTRGLVPPLEFISIAEETGLIAPLSEWVLREALRQMQIWQRQGLPPLRMSINVSAMQFRQKGFVAFLRARLDEYGIDPTLLELELTESLLIDNVEYVLQTLNEIRALGVGLAIDDFGTGFSSLSYLRRFPINCLKIDQSFVRNIECSPANESIARAIIALADSLSLSIIAEGIEKPAELAILENLGCSQGQGYLFAKPIPADEFATWWGENRKLLPETGRRSDEPQA